MRIYDIGELHQRYDGQIPRAELAEALALTRKAAWPVAPHLVAVTHPAPEPSHVILGRMAATAVEVMTLTGSVTEPDLRRHGFTPQQIARHGRRAIAMARPDMPQDRRIRRAG